jgi:cytochrome b561
MTADLSAATTVSKPKRYHPVLVAMHWLTFIFLFAAYFLRSGEGGGEGGGGSLIPGFSNLSLHIIAGGLVFIFLLVRLIVRLRTKRPEWASTGNALLDKIGELTHWALYLLMFGILVTGLVLGLQGNRIARTFGFGGSSIPQFAQGQRPPNQFQPGQFPPPGGGEGGEGFRGGGGFGRGNPLFILGRLHGVVWVLLFLLIALHIGAALYHQFFIKDNLLGRMWFGSQT